MRWGPTARVTRRPDLLATLFVVASEFGIGDALVVLVGQGKAKLGEPPATIAHPVARAGRAALFLGTRRPSCSRA